MRPVLSLVPALVLTSSLSLCACGESTPPPASPETPAQDAGSDLERTNGVVTAPPPAASAAAMPAMAPLTPDAVAAIVSASDRTADDKSKDGSRHPAQFLSFTGVGPGMTVADIGAAGGYTTELLARAVGPSGKVYGQNDPELLKKFAEKPWSARLALAADKNVVRADLPWDAPLPPEAKNLDLVTIVLFYHDTVWLKVDRDKLNKAIFDALKPSGSYVVEDSTSKDGHGLQDVKSLHRIEQSTVESEVEKAGFKLADKGDFLRNPNDKRDWSSSPREAGAKAGTEDRFILRFTKPQG